MRLISRFIFWTKMARSGVVLSAETTLLLNKNNGIMTVLPAVLCIATLLPFSVADETDCKLHYYQHYKIKGCEVANYDPSTGCPKLFQCNDVDKRVCLNQGKSYIVGEEINNTGPCDSCHCRDDGHGTAYIECAEVDCHDWETQKEGCYMGYKEGDCCPTEICPTSDRERQACNYNGKTYAIGQIITTRNPCRSCICTEDWTGRDNGPGCSEVKCLTGIYAKQIHEGCIPIYREKNCCITGMHCGEIYGATPSFDRSGCKYKHRFYDLGSTVYLSGDNRRCVECKCTTPPDFTCLRKPC